MSATLRRREVASWTVGLFGQNLLFSLQLNFALFAFVEILGILPAAVGTMLFLARVFDGFNDPLMGAVADRTRTRIGRFRPWLLVVPVPIALASAAMFFDPGLSAGGTLAYAYVVYFAWGVLYTLGDIPIWALSSAMTSDPAERTRIVSLGRVGALIGMFVPAVGVPVIASAVAPGDPGTGYFIAAALFAGVSAPLMFVAGLGTRERVEVPDDRPVPGELWEGFRQNQALQRLVASAVLGSLALGAQGAFPFFARYNLGDDALVGLLFGVTAVSALTGIALTPWLTRRVGKVRAVVGAAVLRAVVLVVWYVVGWQSLAACIGFVALMSASIAPWMVHLSTMIGDSVDVLEVRTARRHDGVAFSLQTLSAKVSTGLGALVTGSVLAATGFVANQEQTPEALSGIFVVLTLVPAASSLLSTLPLRAYPITPQVHAEAVARLEAARG